MAIGVAGDACRRAKRKEGKQFFFEKKNQKTFVRCGWHPNTDLDWLLDATDKSLLLLFFRKEESSFLKERSKELLLFSRGANGARR
ncbi:MAG TPA: hypothetical protein VMB71_00435 [Acetobacteraceae bacterium]|nr:hypothetical protein [Acetobacteraceae bacterium]